MIALIHQPQIPIHRDFAGQVSLVIINSTIHFWPLISATDYTEFCANSA
jgi:hypothetical protein